VSTITVIIKEGIKELFQHFTKEVICYYQLIATISSGGICTERSKIGTEAICTEQNSVNCNIDGRLIANISNKDLFKIKLE